MEDIYLPDLLENLKRLSETLITKKKERDEYFREHIDLLFKYACILNRRLEYGLDESKLEVIANSHDILKEKNINTDLYKAQIDLRLTFNPLCDTDPVVIENYRTMEFSIPSIFNKYIENNKNVFIKLKIPEYYWDKNLKDKHYDYFAEHAAWATILLAKEFKVNDPEILYPVLMHSYLLVDVYETLDESTRKYIDVIQLADKLSSNDLKIRALSKVPYDLQKVVFGLNGNELNFSTGLYIAILGSKGIKEKNIAAIETIEYRRKQLALINPLVDNNEMLKMGRRYVCCRETNLMKKLYPNSKESLEDVNEKESSE